MNKIGILSASIIYEDGREECLNKSSDVFEFVIEQDIYEDGEEVGSDELETNIVCNNCLKEIQR